MESLEQVYDAIGGILDDMSIEEQIDLLARIQIKVDRNLKASRGAAPTPKGTRKHATRSPSFAEQALTYVLAHPNGVKTLEVAKEIQQTLASAHGTLNLLLRQKKVARHGKHLETLWTPPGVAPVKRIDTIGAAVMKVLEDADAPLDATVLETEALKIIKAETGRTDFAKETVPGEIYRLCKKNRIKKSGANERGPMYVLAETIDGGQHERGLKLVR